MVFYIKNCGKSWRRLLEPHGVARRANAIFLLDEGKNGQAIAEFLYLDDDTVRTWHKLYMSGGFDGLEGFGRKGGNAYLTEAQESELADYLTRNLQRSDHVQLL